ncbi:MAG: EAL domain-containing protein [Mycobacteriales bacterium]
MELARRHLRMDVAFISELHEGRQNYRVLHGDAASFGLRVGGADAVETTYCNLLMQGKIDNVVPDSSANSLTSALAMTGSAGIGSYAGVPLRYSDGTLYGTFCCLGHDAEPHLDERDAAFMAMLAELLTEDLDAQRELEALRDSIARTLRDERLTLALQPVVDLASGRCLAFEALSRFDTGPPDVVFAQAATVGLGVELERLAVRKAVVDLLPLLRAEQYLAVNLTPAAAVALAAVAADLSDQPLDRLALEITEHASIQDYRELRERLDPLRKRGLRVAIDDAGAGFASLHHIVELEPDIIKIDRSLVDGVSANKAQRSIVSAFVLLALDFGACLIAEGVETAADLDVLSSLGVDAAQGYLIGRPSTDRAQLNRWLGTPDLLVGCR